jgi:hypothetical protein
MPLVTGACQVCVLSDMELLFLFDGLAMRHACVLERSHKHVRWVTDVASLMHASVTGDENQPVPLLHSCAVEGLTGAGTKLLCAAGVNLEARCANDGDVRTALMWAAGLPERIENLKALLDAGACMTSSSADSYTALV